MSLSEILSSALSGLGASQAGIRTVSNNIANVNTPGYARETVALQTGITSGRVSGVVVGEPGRVADKFLEATVYTRGGDAGRAAVEAGYLDRLQALLGATGSETALPARLDAIRAAAKGAEPPQVYLRADKALGYGKVMRVMGELNRAGLNRVALVTVEG